MTIHTDTGDGYAATSLLEAYEIARHRIDRALDLMERAADFREQLAMGIWGLDEAVEGKDKFKRACDAHRRWT